MADLDVAVWLIIALHETARSGMLADIILTNSVADKVAMFTSLTCTCVNRNIPSYLFTRGLLRLESEISIFSHRSSSSHFTINSLSLIFISLNSLSDIWCLCCPNCLSRNSLFTRTLIYWRKYQICFFLCQTSSVVAWFFHSSDSSKTYLKGTL